VWDALRAIPFGEVRTYGEIARHLGQPTAARAVARACATNPVALVIPCHRVVPGSGGTGGYRWGADRKRELLEREKRAAQVKRARAR
jgi:O-6-methylguanine DNA methyltransferase